MGIGYEFVTGEVKNTYRSYNRKLSNKQKSLKEYNLI